MGLRRGTSMIPPDPRLGRVGAPRTHPLATVVTGGAWSGGTAAAERETPGASRSMPLRLRGRAPFPSGSCPLRPRMPFRSRPPAASPGGGQGASVREGHGLLRSDDDARAVRQDDVRSVVRGRGRGERERRREYSSTALSFFILFPFLSSWVVVRDLSMCCSSFRDETSSTTRIGSSPSCFRAAAFPISEGSGSPRGASRTGWSFRQA